MAHRSITGFEIDPEALEIAKANIEGAEVANAEIKLYDLLTITSDPAYAKYFDTVVMNPPFGTKNNEGIDMQLLSAAIYVSLYIFYKLFSIGMQRKCVQFA